MKEKTEGVRDAIQHFIDGRNLQEDSLAVMVQLETNPKKRKQYSIRYTLHPENQDILEVEVSYLELQNALDGYEDQVETLEEYFECELIKGDISEYRETKQSGGNPVT